MNVCYGKLGQIDKRLGGTHPLQLWWVEGASGFVSQYHSPHKLWVSLVLKEQSKPTFREPPALE